MVAATGIADDMELEIDYSDIEAKYVVYHLLRCKEGLSLISSPPSRSPDTGSRPRRVLTTSSLLTEYLSSTSQNVRSSS